MAESSGQISSLVSAKGNVQLVGLRPNVLLVRVSGHFDMKLGKFMLDGATRLLGTAQRVTVFCDWAEATGYDSDVRVAFTNWAADHRTAAKFYFLVNSKIVSMGVSVANLALGGLLTVFGSRATFDSALRAAKSGLPIS